MPFYSAFGEKTESLNRKGEMSKEEYEGEDGK